MAELADAPDLGSGVLDVQVRPLSPAPKQSNPNLLPVGEAFGFVVSLKDIKNAFVCGSTGLVALCYYFFISENFVCDFIHNRGVRLQG